MVFLLNSPELKVISVKLECCQIFNTEENMKTIQLKSVLMYFLQTNSTSERLWKLVLKMLELLIINLKRNTNWVGNLIRKK